METLMPSITIRGARLHYEDVGSGPETIVFIHGLMLASESWEAQRAAFRDRYRVITFDLRGQGRSETPRTGLGLDALAEDTVALIEHLQCSPCHLVGFSMGSFIALRVAARRPELVRSLTVIGASADAEDATNLPRYARLIRLVRLLGPRPFASRMMKILFGDTYLQSADQTVERNRWQAYLKRLPRSLHRAAEASAMRESIVAELGSIRAPALVVSGEEDRPVSPARSRAVHAAIPRSQFVSFPHTGHAVMIERTATFNRLLDNFLCGTGTLQGAVEPPALPQDPGIDVGTASTASRTTIRRPDATLSVAVLSLAILAGCASTEAGSRGYDAFAQEAAPATIAGSRTAAEASACFEERARFLPLSEFSRDPATDRFTYRLRAMDLWFEQVRIEPEGSGARAEVRIAPNLNARWQAQFESDRLRPLRSCMGL
jgi:pimeloyl-ACP methyl ester carboxylesterase